MTRRPLLFDYWRSSASYRVRIALNLKGIEVDTKVVNLLVGDQRRPEHMARNPQGAVPVLEVDGIRLTQSLAIIEYLDETRPEPALLPHEPRDRARIRTLSHLVAMEIHPLCNLSVVERVEALGGAEARLNWTRHHIRRGLDAFEAGLRDPRTKTFAHGDMPGLAECCLVPQLYNARRWGLSPEDWPEIARVDANCAEIPAFVMAHPDAIGAPDAA